MIVFSFNTLDVYAVLLAFDLIKIIVKIILMLDKRFAPLSNFGYVRFLLKSEQKTISYEQFSLSYRHLFCPLKQWLFILFTSNT